MPGALEQTITIVNNSGKIIKTGKQLYSVFKDAQGNYKDKKTEIKNQRNLQRSHSSYDPTNAIVEPQRYYDDQYYHYANFDRSRRSIDAGSDRGSQRSRRSRSVASRRDDYDTRSRHALTEGNLKTYTEVSATSPSRPPVTRAFVNPYAEMELAKRDMNHSEIRSQHYGAMVPRSYSVGELVETKKPKKQIDMDLAYGSIPPDLEYRTDLDPKHNYEEKEATGLIHRIESLLDEAKCMHHSATTTIDQLQKDPDKAAAVALSLGELSTLVKKTSPAFLTLMKSASPAVFSLLSSPQFLIGTTAVLGVTAVCFGGWKIVKRVREQDEMRQQALAYEAAPSYVDRALPPARAPTEYGEHSAGVDEALIIDDDLSSIDTWRRGIVPFGEDESADMELITPEAERVTKEMYGKDDFDTRSRRSTRTSKTHESHRSHRSHRSERSERSHKSERSHRSSKTESVAGSERSHRSKRKEKVDTKSIDDGKSQRDDESVVIRPKSHRQTNNMLKALFKPKKERSLVAA